MIGRLGRRLAGLIRPAAAAALPSPRGKIYAEVAFDLSFEAVFGTDADFAQWAVAPRNWLRERIATRPPVRLKYRDCIALRVELGAIERHCFDVFDDRGDRLGFSYDVDVATPVGNAVAPPFLFIHGHGLVAGESNGHVPRAFYEDRTCYHGFGVAFLEARRPFVALPNVIHGPLEGLTRRYDHYVIWASLAFQAADWLRKNGRMAPSQPLLGVAAGGHTAAALSAVDDGVTSLATHGSFFPLDLCRREFVLDGHPDCFEFKAFMSYSPVFALSMPRPLWISMGRGDALSLKIAGVPASPGFSGLSRGAISDEVLGAAMMLRHIWSRGGVPFEFAIRDGGHEDFDTEAWLAWELGNAMSPVATVHLAG